MKKFVALVLCLLTVFTAVCAVAETAIYWKGDDTSEFHAWSTPAKSSGKSWHFEWGDGTNIASNRRAVVRIMSNGKYASSLYVYSTKSTAYHKYISTYAQGNADTYAAGRLDDRDGAQGPLVVTGNFFN